MKKVSCYTRRGQIRISLLIQRLYFTQDGISPFKYRNTGLFNDTIHMVRKQIVLGLLYTFLIQPMSSSEPLEHHFVVSRDRNLQYHIFKHTLAADVTPNNVVVDSECGSQVDQCSDGVLDDVLTQQSFRAANSSTQVLRVASYNIWNVNGLEAEGEKYETRLQRLKKVGTPAVCPCREVKSPLFRGCFVYSIMILIVMS